MSHTATEQKTHEDNHHLCLGHCNPKAYPHPAARSAGLHRSPSLSQINGMTRGITSNYIWDTIDLPSAPLGHRAWKERIIVYTCDRGVLSLRLIVLSL